MKKALFILFTLSITIGISQSKVLEGKSAYNNIKNANTVRLKSYTQTPNFVKFIEGKEPSISEALKLINNKSKNEIKLTLINSTKDQLGITHNRYQQKNNGYPVEYSMYNFHLKNNKVLSVNGDLFSNQPNTASPVLPFTTALYIAKGIIGANIYKWEVPNEELFIKEFHQDNSATFMPQKELVYITKDVNFKNELRLAYKIDVYAHFPMSRTELYIDATNGELLFENNLIHTADITGTATTAYSGNRNITTDSFSSSFRLRETGRGNGIETYDLNRGTSAGAAVDFTDGDNNWANFNPDLDEYAADAHFGAEMTYDYYMQVHGRNSIDGNGFKLRSYIHYDSNYVNAFWNNLYMTYGDGNASSNPLTSLDIAGHEITHGLISRTANLVYSYESGALNESFADIFGVSIDFWSRPATANWLMGDEIYTNGTSYFRSMSNPNAKGDPDTYLGNNWYGGTGDNGGVHTNSGVQNYWYYLMCNGGSGTNDLGDPFNVSGIGMTDASKIAFRNLTVYLNSTSQYEDSRFYAIQSALDLYGTCSPEVIATTHAWYSVGVGADYVAGVQSDFVAIGTKGCTAPFTVSFTNLSNNGATFNWNFGDGGTSTQENPTHTFNTPGVFNIQLYADGGACGNDTEIKSGYIDIQTGNPCPVNMVPNSTTTKIECQGILYDNGGANNIYSANQNTIVTIAPTGATQVLLNIVSIDIESFTNCGYDYLKIYDGIDTSASLIGKYCNTNTPPTSINSSGGSITIYFHSDQGLNLNGFQIDWNCVQSSSTPIAQFSSNNNTVCPGEAVYFTNQTVNANSYTWSFPNGNPSSSNATNPIITYSTPGIYNVQLIGINANGNDTVLQTSYITVDSICSIILPAGGTHPIQTACLGILIDNGGLNGAYTPNQDTYVTISPTGATQVTLNFLFFDVEDGSTSSIPPCGFDYLEVFDGTDVNATLLGVYCNNNPPPANLVSSGGSITIHFHSDPGLHLQGFKIQWECDNNTASKSIDTKEIFSEINIYPNPTYSIVNINLELNKEQPLSIRLIDMLGKTHFNTKTAYSQLKYRENINFSRLTKGTYILYINNVPYKVNKN
jgi:Zn-dependent metalloprotease/PKD repeat protein